MNKMLYVLALLFFMQSTVSGQSAEIRDVRKREFRGVKAIINKTTNESEGYYAYYVNDKVRKGMVNFIIQIFDLDLKLVKQTPISMSKNSVIESSVFNGTDFFFIFRDIGKKKLSYVTIDKKGEIVSSLGVKEKRWGSLQAEAFPSPDGFYIVKTIKEKKWGYSINKVDRNIETIWERKFLPKKGFLTVEAVESSNNRIMVVQMLRQGLFAKKAKSELVCLDDKSGDKVYGFQLFDGEFTAIPSSFLIEEDGSVATGGMYFKGQLARSNNSNGIFFLRLDPQGKQTVFTKTDWDDGIQALLKSNKKKFIIGSKPKVMFHDIVKAEDGSYQVISETFKTVVVLAATTIGRRGRMVGRFGGNNNQVSGFHVEDFIIFNFNSDGHIANLNKIEKDHIKILVGEPYSRMGGLKQATAMKAFGYFDFAFTTHLEGSTQEIIVSSNMANRKPYIGFISVKPGEESVMQRLDIDNNLSKMRSFREDDFVGVVKGRPGKVCIYYYDRKEKTVHLYIQDIKL